MSYPVIRTISSLRSLSLKYPRADAIAGVATGAIAPGFWLPIARFAFVYIRSTPKDWTENLIEGDLRPGQRLLN